jgi:NAD(P)-dependent dehydrogenase (short-subunit alcohol dehydrogenase family)
MDLRDGIAVVTGAGGGLGRALARRLAAEGLRVAALGRDAAALAETAASAPGAIVPVRADVADAQAVRDAFASIAALGQVTILVNNAALYPRRDFLDETAESFMATVAVNLGGVVACTRAALGPMTQTGLGRILNVATFADVAPLPASGAYAVGKGAARILTRALVADLGDRFPGIVISDWMPGMLATRMGIPDGLPAETAAVWGARLALWHDPTLNGTTWEQDREILPPRGLKGRLLDRLTGRRRLPRRL